MVILQKRKDFVNNSCKLRQNLDTKHRQISSTNKLRLEPIILVVAQLLSRVVTSGTGKPQFESHVYLLNALWPFAYQSFKKFEVDGGTNQHDIF